MKEKIDYGAESLRLHAERGGKIFTGLKFPLDSREDLAVAYTPGVAEPCRVIAQHPEKFAQLVSAGRTVAVISDGSAVLGLGNIGARAAMPVMEGKAALFKKFADIDAVPIVLATQDVDEIVATIKNIAPSFAGINLEDISAPRCFEVEQRLKKELDMPVFHDDQYGTAIVVLAGLINALKVADKKKGDIRVVVNGVGAAGTAITKLLYLWGVKTILLVDSRGLICANRDDLNSVKQELLELSDCPETCGNLRDALVGADVFIGVSQPDVLGREEVGVMAQGPIVFAMSNPNPEIDPARAHEYGVAVMATGRSDYPNQINNVLVFPGIFRGAFDGGKTAITDSMKLSAAEALANLIPTPTAEQIIPDPFAPGVMEAVAQAVQNS